MSRVGQVLEVSMRVPDYLAPLVGYRVWRVAPGGLLTGVHVPVPRGIGRR